MCNFFNDDEECGNSITFGLRMDYQLLPKYAKQETLVSSEKLDDQLIQEHLEDIFDNEM